MNVGFHQYDHLTIILRIMKSGFGNFYNFKKNLFMQLPRGTEESHSELSS
jgi:hypothetical protein